MLSPARPDREPPSAGEPVRYRCRHTTRYEYADDVPVSHHICHLSARPHPLQRPRRGVLTVQPGPAVRADHTDYFGNPVTYIALQEPHRQLVVTAESEIEVHAAPVDPAGPSPAWESLRDAMRAEVTSPGTPDVLQFAFDSALVRCSGDLADYARPSFPADRPVAEAAVDLMTRIHADFAFDPTATTVATPLAEVLARRRGVCQDFAHLIVGALRSLGLPARYVSGYLRTLPPPGKPRLVGADASHAWGAVWCGGERWLDLCPTNGRVVDQDFITVAWGRDYDDVSPIRGVMHGGASHWMSVEVDVERIA